MASSGGPRPVYSTGLGRLCPDCGAPIDVCRCGAASQATVPTRVVAKLRIEKSCRGGKTVTVVDGLPANDAFLKDLAHALKKACGVGGAVGEHHVELQGDQRERLRPVLAAKGWTVKG